jgi:hypothetical protein
LADLQPVRGTGLVEPLMQAGHHQHLIGDLGKESACRVGVAGARLLEGHQVINQPEAVAHAVIDLAHHHALGHDLAFLFGQFEVARADHTIDRQTCRQADDGEDGRGQTKRQQQHGEKMVGASRPLAQQRVLVIAHRGDQARQPVRVSRHARREIPYRAASPFRRGDLVKLDQILREHLFEFPDHALLMWVIERQSCQLPDITLHRAADALESKRLPGIVVQPIRLHRLLQRHQIPHDAVDRELNVAGVADPGPRIPGALADQRAETKAGQRQDDDARELTGRTSAQQPARSLWPRGS